MYCRLCYHKKGKDPQKCQVNSEPSLAFEHFYAKWFRPGTNKPFHIANRRCRLYSINDDNFGWPQDCTRCTELLSIKSTYLNNLKNMKDYEPVNLATSLKGPHYSRAGKYYCPEIPTNCMECITTAQTIKREENDYYACPRKNESNPNGFVDIPMGWANQDEYGEKMKFDENGCHIDAFEQPMWAGMKDYQYLDREMNDLRMENIDCFKTFSFICEFKEHMDNHDITKGKSALVLHVYPQSELLKDSDKLLFAESLKEHYEQDENVYKIHSIDGTIIDGRGVFLKPPLDVTLILKENAKIEDIKSYPPGVKKMYVFGPKPLNDAKDEFLEEEIMQKKDFTRAYKANKYLSKGKENYSPYNVPSVQKDVKRIYRQEEEEIQFHDSCHIPPFKIIDQKRVADWIKWHDEGRERHWQHVKEMEELKELNLSYELKEIRRLKNLIPLIDFDLPEDDEDEDSPQFWKIQAEVLKWRLRRFGWKSSTPASEPPIPCDEHVSFEDLKIKTTKLEVALLKCTLPTTGVSYSLEEVAEIERKQSIFYETCVSETSETSLFETSEDESSFYESSSSSDTESDEQDSPVEHQQEWVQMDNDDQFY